MTLQVNGYTYDFGDVRNQTEGNSLEGVTSVSYGYGKDPTKFKGQGRKATGRTKGSMDSDDAEIIMKKSYWDAWKKKLGPGFMNKTFTYTVSYADDGQNVDTDTLEDCEIIKVKKNPKQGSEPITVTLTLSVMNVLDGGLDPMDATAVAS